jgi:hypothetical protein
MGAKIFIRLLTNLKPGTYNGVSAPEIFLLRICHNLFVVVVVVVAAAAVVANVQ